MNRQTDIVRLMQRIAVRASDLCWPWIGTMNSSGYGQFWLDGHNINSSRAVYLLLIGPIPEGMVVCHSCDDRGCCNPAHLWRGTQGDNVRDCHQKMRARGTFPHGSAHPRLSAKLTTEQVLEARSRHASGVSQSQIARELGVHSSTISRAVRGEKWGHL